MLDFLFYRIYHIGEIFNFDMLKSQKLFLSPLREVVVVAVLLDQWPPTLSSSPTSSPSLALSCPSLSSSPSCLSSRMQGLFLIGWSRSVLVIAFTASINFGREQVTSAPLLVQICTSYSALYPQSFCETGPHLHRSGTTVRDHCRTFCFKFWHNKSLFFLAEGDVLLGQEVMVPVLCLQTQASQQTLQLLSDFRVVVNDRQRVGKSVGFSNPVVCRVGYFSLICLYLFPEPQISLNLGVWTVGRNSAWPLHPVFLNFKTWWFHLTSSVQTSSSEALYNTIVISNNTEPVNECAPSQGQ